MMKWAQPKAGVPRKMSLLLSSCRHYTPLPLSSHQALKIDPVYLPRTPKKRQSHGSEKSSTVVGYYGLTTPPYKLDALEPYMSKRTLELHWGGYHHDCVERLNKQIKDSSLYGYTLEELIKKTYNNGNPLPEFNNAAEVWNHDFFWESMHPNSGKLPWGSLLQQIEKDFGSFSNFKDEFIRSAMGLFGSGWVWLVYNIISVSCNPCNVPVKRVEKKLAVVRTSNAVCPLVFGDFPIIALDMWEHAYYLDYKDDRRRYVSNYMNHLVSWHSATIRIIRAEAFVNLGEPKIPVA